MSSTEDGIKKTSTAQFLHKKYTGGPHGLGDPDDLYLRKVEKDVLIPKKMRELARVEKCAKEVADFSDCCKGSGVLMVFSCRKENAALKSCLTKWYEDDNFKEHCKNAYLTERSEYRRTGLTQKQKRIGSSM